MSAGIPYGDWRGLELEIQGVRDQLARKAPSQPFSTDAIPLTSGQSAPPSGIAKVQNVATITVTWNPVPVDLRYYEIQFSTSIGFSKPITKQTQETEYTFVEGVAGTTYYARVRTATIAGTISDWSSSLNTTTGTATFADLAPGAATDQVDLIQTTGFTEVDTSGTLDFTSNALSKTVVDGEVLYPMMTAKVQYATFLNPGALTGPQMIIKLIRDGDTDNPIDEFASDVPSTVGDVAVPTYALLTPPGLGLPDEPAVGVHTYAVYFEVNVGDHANNRIRILPTRIYLTMLGFRN